MQSPRNPFHKVSGMSSAKPKVLRPGEERQVRVTLEGNYMIGPILNFHIGGMVMLEGIELNNLICTHI